MRISGQGYLHLIEEARCCRPQKHPNSYEDCYDEDAGTDWRQCKQAGYYMAGFSRGSCDDFDCMGKLRCCKMENSISLSFLMTVNTYLGDYVCISMQSTGDFFPFDCTKSTPFSNKATG